MINSRRSRWNCIAMRSDSLRHHGRSCTVANGGPWKVVRSDGWRGARGCAPASRDAGFSSSQRATCLPKRSSASQRGRGCDLAGELMHFDALRPLRMATLAHHRHPVAERRQLARQLPDVALHPADRPVAAHHMQQSHGFI